MTDADPGPPVFRADGALFAPRFEDLYFQADGLAEARHVFLAGNDLGERLATRRRTTIGETGFGTGLNFLATWDLFRRVAPPGSRLCFVSVEAFPLAAETARRALAAFPELGSLAAALLDGWDADARGLVRRTFDGGRVVLCELRGDIEEMLRAHRFWVDAWFLDGFAPSRNPRMWSEAALRAVAARTRRGATFATFTVASAVRRGLEDAGFAVDKRAGFGRKREMLGGRLQRPTPDPTPPWLRIPDRTPPQQLTVVGAGLAGAGAAHALAARGIDVTVVDRVGIAAGASGHGLAVLQPRAGPEPDARFVAHAFRHTREMVLRAAPDAFWPCGVLHPALDRDAEITLRGRIDDGRDADVSWIDAATCDGHAGAALGARGAAWIPHAGVVRAAAVCAALLDHPRIAVGSGDGDGLHGPRVLAHALGARSELEYLTMRANRGQLTVLDATDDSPPRCVVSHGGYLTPAIDGCRAVGATYGPDDEDPIPRAADDDVNLARFRTAFPLLADALTTRRRPSWTGIRATTSDRLPYVGPLPDAAAFDSDYAAAWCGGRSTGLPEPTFVDDVFVSLAHGSRGVATGPFAGELIAAMICGEPIPLDDDLLVRILPVRALVRRARRAGAE